MSSGIDTKHGKLLAEMVVPSSSWNVQPEKQDPFKSQEAALDYLNSNNVEYNTYYHKIKPYY